MNTKDIKITTTSGFDGHEVKEYLEPVTAHVVIGMNIFKDFMTGLTDIFGGKSKTYQSTLSSINAEVLDQLRLKAKSIGANCVLGLKIDNDEISSQGKSMVMVTAVGTAAIVNFRENESDNNGLINSKLIDSENIEKKRKKKYYSERISNGHFELNDDFLLFSIDNKVHEFAPTILTYLTENSNDYDRVTTYFEVINEDYAKDVLYSSLIKKDVVNHKSVIRMIIELQYVDIEMIGRLLQCPELSTKKIGLELLKHNKKYYDNADIQHLRNLLQLIEVSFDRVGETYLKKKSLMSKEKEVWRCTCGYENEVDASRCNSCLKDTFGFDRTEASPSIVIEKLNEDILILNSFYNLK